MAMSRKDFQGTGKVFSFTFQQMLKNKANMATLILLLVFALCSIPFMVLMGGEDAKEQTSITTVYVQNETDVDFSDFGEREPYFAGMKFAEADFEASDYGENLNDNEVLLRLYRESLAGGYRIEVSRLSEEKPGDEEVSLLLGAVQSVFDQARYQALGISQDQLEILETGFAVDSQSADDFLEEQEEESASFETRYWIQYVYAILVMMLSMMSISYIIRAIVEEKSSKLVELLMVSVKPLALIVGKILAAMAFVFGMFALMAAGVGISYVVTGLFWDVSSVGNTLSGMGISGELLHLDIPALISILISLLTGYLTFSIIAGLFGSACSSTSEMESAIMAPTMIILAGYLVSCMISAADGGTVVLICCLCPVISVFCAPVQYLVGNIGFGVLTLSWVLQLAAAVLLALFCAKIYRELIIYRGSRVRVKDMIAMAKGSTRKGEVN